MDNALIALYHNIKMHRSLICDAFLPHKYNIQYFDTSYKREEVLKEALDYVLENCAQ